MNRKYTLSKVTVYIYDKAAGSFPAEAARKNVSINMEAKRKIEGNFLCVFFLSNERSSVEP